MKRLGLILATVLTIGTALLSAPVIGQNIDTGVTGAGAGIFPEGATFHGVRLSGFQLGQGILIASDGTATGDFHVVLLGTSLLGQRQDIVVDTLECLIQIFDDFLRTNHPYHMLCAVRVRGQLASGV